MTGARAILSINKKIVAFATNVSYRVDVPHSAVAVLGRYSYARHEPIGIDCSVTCGVVRFTKEGGNGNAPDGQSKIYPKLQDILNSDELTIEIVDRKTKENLITIHRARMTGRNGSLGARDTLTEGWTFVGVIAEDGDSGPQSESPGANTEAGS
jgi:hypothetical protein